MKTLKQNAIKVAIPALLVIAILVPVPSVFANIPPWSESGENKYQPVVKVQKEVDEAQEVQEVEEVNKDFALTGESKYVSEKEIAVTEVQKVDESFAPTGE